MKIAIISENSQASKNKIIYDSLKKVIPENNIINMGMFDDEDQVLTYVENGLLAAVLLNTKMADFVITGCGTGMGASLSLNSFPNVYCGLVETPLDAYLFSQINGGNAISIPYAKNFGWGSELQLEYIFEKLFKEEFGGGYPKERALSEQTNAQKLKEIKKITTHNMLDILKNIDNDMLVRVFKRQSFIDIIDTCQDKEIKNFLENIIK